VAADPEGEKAAREAAGRGRMRASGADREQAVEVLKVAFVQDRLTKDELDARVSQALVARTYADLAGLTDDLPGDASHASHAVPVPMPSAAARAASVTPAPGRTLAIAARRAGICLLGTFACTAIELLSKSSVIGFLAFVGITWTPIAASGFLGHGIMEAWRQRRDRQQLPPGPARGGPGGQQPASAGHSRTQPLGEPRRRTRADLRAHGPRPASSRSASPRTPAADRPAPGRPAPGLPALGRPARGRGRGRPAPA
jgi:hypothetical protein